MGYTFCKFYEHRARDTSLRAFIYRILIKNLSKNLSFGGPVPLSLHRWGVKFGTEEGTYLPTKWHLDPSSHFTTKDMGRKLGTVPLWEGGVGSNTPTSQTDREDRAGQTDRRRIAYGEQCYKRSPKNGRVVYDVKYR